MAIDSNAEKLPPNEPRGNIDLINDEVAETDQVSTGPVLARLISALRPENRPDNENTVNGDSMDIDGDTQQNGDHPTTNGVDPQSPSTHMPESAQASWKNQPTTAVPRLDYAAMDERLLGELRHIGFVAEDQFPEFDKQADDEVSARLRYLQTELRRQSIINGARKARVLELAEERLAMQEYGTIADDLDGQINQAYLKRNRNMGKGKKGAKRPGAGPGVAVPSGVGKPGVGQPVRELLERKKAWNAMIGPVVNAGRASIPTETIFDPDTMKKMEAKEQEIWDGGLEE
jgi:transcriptional adapter 3